LKGFYTEKQLDQILRKWQKKLRLQDWELDIFYVDPEQFSKEGSCGEVRAHVNRKIGVIGIGRPELILERDPDYCNHEIEDTIIHELLHLHLNPFTPFDDDLGMLAVEQAIEAISRVLLAEHYGQSKPKANTKRRPKQNHRSLRKRNAIKDRIR
jgi:hypothetical protein